MAHYLGKGITMLLAGLAPDVIVPGGDISAGLEQGRAGGWDVLKERSSTQAPTKIMASGLTPQPRLRGIIALVLQKHLGVPN